MKAIERGIKFFNTYLPLDKVYLDVHRGPYDVSRATLEAARKAFESAGIAVSGGITFTLGPDSNEGRTIFDTFCYTDTAQREKCMQITEYAASLFDEIIFDDFFFTSCRCDKCIEAKGDKSWEEYRLNLMADVASEMNERARKINPYCKLVIKYPNWYESYQACGYNPQVQKDIFGGIYTGTESRHPYYSQQHLQRYLSYSMIRLMENIAPSRNGGGWIDAGDSNWNPNIWLEQAALTLLAKAKELTLFSFHELSGSQVIPPLGLLLQRLDGVLGQAGAPRGVAVYEPYNADGEDQLMNYIGMAGLPLEPKPYFDKAASMVFLTQSAACDDQIVTELDEYLRAGGKAVITSGFLKATLSRGTDRFTTLRPTGRRIVGNEYWLDFYKSNDLAGCAGTEPISMEVFSYKTNATWCDAALIAGESNAPLLTRDFYGKGQLFTWVIPDNFSDLYKYPCKLASNIGRIFGADAPVYLEAAPKYNLFCYDNGVFAVQNYRQYPEEISVVLKAPYRSIVDLESGAEYKAACIRPAHGLEGAAEEGLIPIKMWPGDLKFFRVV
jgi:hypothetical protein